MKLLQQFLSLLNPPLDSGGVPTGDGRVTPYPSEYDVEHQSLVPGKGANPFSWLGYFLALGRAIHGPVADEFMVREGRGYYHYEKQDRFLTNAVAAAYAGAFGRESVEAQPFSPSLAKWRLSHLLGMDLDQVRVSGPTGRTQPVLDEMIDLMHTDGWSRAGIADWLYSLGGQ